MNENRLNVLAHLYIKRDIELYYADVIYEFSKKHRLLNFQWIGSVELNAYRLADSSSYYCVLWLNNPVMI